MPNMVNFSLRVSIFETERRRVDALALPHAATLALLVARHRVALSVAQLHRDIRHRGGADSHYSTGRYVTDLHSALSVLKSASPGDALSEQDRVFERLGVQVSSPEQLIIPFDAGSIEFHFAVDEQILGSFCSKFSVSAAVRGVGRLGESVVAALLAGVLSGPVQRAMPPQTGYYCTISAVLTGDKNRLIREAADDLRMPEDSSTEQQEAVWRSRQLGMAADGVSIGRLDGLYGANTRRAENDYARKNGGIHVNWDSQVFREYVIEKAMKHPPATVRRSH